MNLFLTIVIFLAVCAAVAACVNILRPTPNWRRAPDEHADVGGAQPVQVSCAPDGVAVTSLGTLRSIVLMVDRMIETGRAPGGRPMAPLDIRKFADGFAQWRAEPSVTLAQLEQCEDDLRRAHPHGYWMVSAALVRESARRHGVEAVR